MAEEAQAIFEIDTAAPGGDVLLTLKGAWTVHASRTFFDQRKKRVAAIKAAGAARAVIDLSGIEQVDTAGAWLIRLLQDDCRDAGLEAELSRMNDRIAELMEAIPDELPEPEKPPVDSRSLGHRIVEQIGRSTVSAGHDLYDGLGYFGALFVGLYNIFTRRSGVNFASVTAQLDHMGVRAVPIIALMSFLVGGIIAQQGAFQLRYFGAELFVVDLVGILQLREIGVLLTAIMIAGRSGSAITAEIGAMKMREEIDALRVMGFDAIAVLVFPRMLALLIALPLLTIVANFSALAGAAIVVDVYCGITFQTFMQRLHEAVTLSTVISGMAKAPFMALIIAIVASMEGMKVGGSAESLGKKVTAAVVKAIFIVIVVDGIFAMFYAAINF
ncbi:MlaE family lipid ABC transporter permease subunit [Martelella sp. HB161492]|uniref:ABC transporter permease n=1 Tax=Martelella sp. HB161492 TaxID=2720726 RepID=UPI001AEDECEF|nr:MlaE family lipid ABC transporter permease subunit [Martelella sp. HB161492]